MLGQSLTGAASSIAVLPPAPSNPSPFDDTDTIGAIVLAVAVLALVVAIIWKREKR